MASSKSYPPGGTFFDTIKKNFTQVPVDKDQDNAISTSEFLEAVESLTTLFDVIGSVAFSPVKSDMQGNIKKIRSRQLACPGESEDIQSLVINEIKAKKHIAAEGLLWLVRIVKLIEPDVLQRGLDFTAQALRQNVASNTEELSTSFLNAYSSTLKPYHSFMVKPIFSAAMSATPYRKDFYIKLGDDIDKVQHELRLWLSALETQVGILKGFQSRKEAKW